MKIAVVGIGYVGLANAVLLAQHHEVIALDIDHAKVDKLNARISPIADPHIERFLRERPLNLRATQDHKNAYSDAEFVMIAVPTDYDPTTKRFRTELIDSIIKDVMAVNQAAVMVIKSTVPIGYTADVRKKLETENLIFSPEFLREGKALYDTLYPSRIIIGEKSARAETFANLLRNGAEKKDAPVLYTNSNEAEAIKLFANGYLAMRVAYMNELDSYALANGLDAKQIIDGVSLDPRIGTHHNNPSFGYGGYCLPKDTQQLLTDYQQVPQNLITAIVGSNQTRKAFIARTIAEQNPQRVGIYRLIAKTGVDNFREAAILDVIDYLKAKDIDIMIYEPSIADDRFLDCVVENDLMRFKAQSDIILANRLDPELNDVSDKIFSRDLYNKN
ncbi:MAG: nucleotide sugar dehydrogenase [Pseudomonadota bacterium]